MIGIDTNVLLRLLLADDRAQAERAAGLLRGLPDRAVMNDLVLAETAWTLQRSAAVDRARVLATVDALLSNNRLVPADGVAERALTEARSHGLDLADALIGVRNAALGCDTTYTFDQRAARSPLFTLVP